MRLSEIRDWWLPQAKTLGVGQSVRVAHPGDVGSRPSLVLRNTQSGYSAWCFRRNAGDWVTKEHALPTQEVEHDTSEEPPDLECIYASKHVTELVGHFLVRSGVTPEMFPKGSLQWSRGAQRLCITHNGITLGRDIWGKSSMKWVDYTQNSKLVWSVGGADTVVLVEDVLSAHKVHHVTGLGSVAVLGTQLRDAHLNYLYDAKRVVVMPDGDAAGRKAMRAWGRDLRGIGKDPEYVTVPKGKDPKNLTYKELRDMLWIYS